MKGKYLKPLISMCMIMIFLLSCATFSFAYGGPPDITPPKVTAPPDITIHTSTAGCTAYTDCYYGAYAIDFGIGSFKEGDLNAKGLSTNNWAALSSMKVKKGYRITCYSEDNFAGDCVILESDENNFYDIGFNDKTKSIKVQFVDAGTAHASDSSGIASLTSNAPAVFPIGTTIVTWTAVDNAHNSNTDTQTVKIIDDTNPTVPTINFTSPAGYVSGNLTNQDVKFTITNGKDFDSGIKKSQYSLNGGTNWYDYNGEVTLSTEGTTSIIAKTVDNAGNESSNAKATVKIDKTAPAVPNISGIPTTWTNEKVTITITAEEGASIEYKKDDGSWIGYTAPFEVDANCVVTARATDEAANVGPEASLTITNIDKTLPTGSILINSDAAYTNNKNVILTISASDLGSGIDKMMISQKSDFSGAIWNNYETSKAIDLDGSDGTKTVYIKFKDIAGNVSEVASDSINLDRMPPTVKLTHDHGKLLVKKGDVITITATFSEDMAATPTIKIDAVGDSADIKDAAMTGSGKVWTYTWTVPAGHDGLANVTVDGSDLAGNGLLISGIIPFIIDNTEPGAPNTPEADEGIGTIIDKTEKASGFDIQVKFGDNGIVTDTVELLLNGTGIGTHEIKLSDILLGGKSCTFSVKAEMLGADGNQSFKARIIDRAGNIGPESGTLVLVLDTTAPVITRLGDAEVTIEQGNAYTDAGATALDAIEGDITSKIVTVNPVDTSVLGEYTVTYNVSDLAGNTATEVTRKVTVVEPTEIEGEGTGLLGLYYGSNNFTDLKVVRIDPIVDFDWGTGTPDAKITTDAFAVKWQGFVQPRYTGTYTFYTRNDDGANLNIDEQVLIDDLDSNHGTTEFSGTIDLVAGEKYPITLQFRENQGYANIDLSWSSNRQAKEIIPQSQLYPAEITRVNGVTLPETLELYVEDESTLTPAFDPADATYKEVTWTTSDSSIASVDSNGKVTALAAGTAVITVTTADGGKTDTCSVTVSEKQNETVSVTGVSVLPKTLLLTVYQFSTLTATVEPDNATCKNVTWKSSEPGIVAVDEDGDVTALAVGTAVITVTTEDGSKTDTCSITVRENNKWNTLLESLKISKGTLTPGFNAETLNYRATVSHSVKNITVTAVAQELKKLAVAESVYGEETIEPIIRIQGIVTESGVASSPIDLKVGSNLITVDVAIGEASETYTITVKRKSGGGSSPSSTSSSSTTTTSSTSTPKEEEPAPAALEEKKDLFKDLDNHEWAKEQIEELAANGIVKGKEPGLFMPEDKVTRAEFAEMLVNLLGVREQSATSNYSDVKLGDWYYGAVASADKAGFILGYPDGTFGPDKLITREEIATMVRRILVKYKNITIPDDVLSNLTFKDKDSISEYAKESVAVAVLNKIMKGYPDDNTFGPLRDTTRAEAAVVIYNLFKMK
ncbi:MAG: S-layer homology domain-containing protein [Ignavibacteriales bacterium]